MSDDVHCDGCQKRGRRPRMYPAPADWLYLEAKDDDTGEVVIVSACSEACAMGLWRKGPGPRFSAAEVMGTTEQTPAPEGTP